MNNIEQELSYAASLLLAVKEEEAIINCFQYLGIEINKENLKRLTRIRRNINPITFEYHLDKNTDNYLYLFDMILYQTDNIWIEIKYK